jgi:glycerol-3-phosphate cytidylyltransferase-like family protein
MKKIVIMPGGFHPFHAGHYALYKSAVKAFPDADVYVAATDDTKNRPFPFSIKEKLAKLAGVASGRFVQVKSPFQAKEITQNYNPDQDVLIFVRSEKDINENPKPGGTKKDGTPAYFQPYTGKNMQPFSKHGYMAYLPTVEFGPGIKSATEIRNLWPDLNDKRKTAMVMSLYPTTQKNPKLAANVVKMLDAGINGELKENTDGKPTWVIQDKDHDGKPEVKIKTKDRLVYQGDDPINKNLVDKARKRFPNARNDIEAVFHYFAVTIDELQDELELIKSTQAPKEEPQPVAQPQEQPQPQDQPADQATNLPKPPANTQPAAVAEDYISEK